MRRYRVVLFQSYLFYLILATTVNGHNHIGDIMLARFINKSSSPLLYVYTNTITSLEAAQRAPPASTVADKPLRTEQQLPCTVYFHCAQLRHLLVKYGLYTHKR